AGGRPPGAAPSAALGGGPVNQPTQPAVVSAFRASGRSADLALPAVHVVDRFALEQPGHPVDESLAVDLLGVERLVADHRGCVAPRGVAEEVHAGLLALGLVAV